MRREPEVPEGRVPVVECLDGPARIISKELAPIHSEWILDGGAWQLQRYDENGLLRSLSGRLASVRKVLCSAAEIACKGRQDFYLAHDGGWNLGKHNFQESE